MGKKILLSRTIWIEQADIERLATTGTKLVHNPSANTKMGSGITTILDMIRVGINVVLGCDGGPSNNTHDMIRKMKWVLHSEGCLDGRRHHARRDDAGDGDDQRREDAGADEDTGSIEPGKRADLTAVDMRGSHLRPAPVGTLVASANGSDVSHVMVDGRLLVRRGKVLTRDEKEILKRMARAAKGLYARTGVKILVAWPVE